MGPGIITGFAGNDAGGVTTYTAVGAHYGFEMMWLVLLSTAGLLVIQEMCARMGAVTGKGRSDLVRERFGVRWTIVAMLALLIANGSNIVAEYAGIAASLELFHVQRIVSVPIAAVLIWVLVVFFSYRIVERALFVLVLAYIAYPISAFIVGPPWGEVVRDSVIPSLPIGQAALIAALALVGTTITPYMQFYIQASVVDKGIDRDQYRFERGDVLLGAILTGLDGLLLPIVLVFILKLAGDRRIMGDHANGRVSQWIGIGTAIGASVLSIALVAITILGAG